ncbi:programmed cell death 1 ligand 1-like [Gastrophryne carolinensis]
MASRVFFLFSVLLVLDITQAKLEILAEPSTIVANPGDKVDLKCVIQNIKGQIDLKNLVIQWFTRGKDVAEFDNTITIKKEGLSMSLDAIKKGDGTLTIASFKPEDAGYYRCYVTYGLEDGRKQITLTSSVPPKADEEKEELTTCETILDKKLDKVISMLGAFDTKLDGLSKGCPSQDQKRN